MSIFHSSSSGADQNPATEREGLTQIPATEREGLTQIPATEDLLKIK